MPGVPVTDAALAVLLEKTKFPGIGLVLAKDTHDGQMSTGLL